MSPTGAKHARIEMRLGHALESFVSQKKNGWVMIGEAGIYTRRNPDSVRGADILFISKKRLAGPPRENFLDVAPELVIEIQSPSEPWPELRKKIAEYFDIGVNVVWVVKPRNRRVQIYHSTTDVTELAENDVLTGEDILSGFKIKVSQLFVE